MAVTASPAFKINSHAATSTATVSAGASVSATLDSIAGVDTVVWSITGTDGSVDASSYTLTPSGSKGETVQFTAGAAGTAGILSCTINSGRNPQTGNREPAYTATAKWAVLTNGYEVGAVGELLEADSVYGSTKLLNATIRGTAGVASGASIDWKNSVKCIAPANLANLASVSTSQDGYTIAAGDRVGLVFQTTATENGIYTAGTPSGGFVALTRAVDFDEAADVTDGAAFTVERGTIWAGTTWVLRVGASINFGTTNLRFACMPGALTTAQGAGGSVVGRIPTTGEVRIGYNGGIYTRNAALTTDYRVIGNDATDGVVIGDAVASQVVTNVKTGGYIGFQVNSSEVGRFVVGALQFGTNPAAAGVLRFANNVVIANARNAANSADLEILRTDSSNNLYIGFGSASPNIYLAPATNVIFAPGGAVNHVMTTTAFTWDTSAASWTLKQADKTTNSGTGATLTVQAQNETGTTSVGGAVVTTSGTGTSRHGANRMQIGGTTNVEVAQVVASQTVVALARNADLTSTEMPSNSGDKVVYIGNAATAPTANSVSGVILYSESGILKYRDTSGFVVTI
jgi:hypothetical protein